MKAVLLAAILVAGSAKAQVLRPVDQTKHLDANDKTVDMPTVSFGTVPQSTRPQPVSPLSGQMRERAANVETKRVDTPKTLSYSTVPTTIVPQQNFTPKRAVADVPGNRPPAKNVKTSKAEISKMVIRPLNPTGEEELKKQLSDPR
jgi:hypothetical protein